MALFSSKTWDQWVNEYAQAHQHPVNRLCHSFGIPLIVLSLLLLVLALFWKKAIVLAIWCFVIGWVLQFVGHYFEKKPPEFFKDWRFLFVGLRWWLQHIGASEPPSRDIKPRQ